MAEQYERALHSVLKPYHVRGEWFEYGPIARPIQRMRADIGLDEACALFREHLVCQRRVRRKRGGAARGNVSLPEMTITSQ